VRREAALALVNVCISTLSIYSHCLFSEERDDGWAAIDRKAVKKNIFKTIYSYTRWCWVLLALASLALQATRTATSSATHKELLSLGEMGMTFAFDLEIIVRILAALPDWRTFFVHGQILARYDSCCRVLDNTDTCHQEFDGLPLGYPLSTCEVL